MTDEPGFPIGPKKRGRPRKNPDTIGPDPKTTEKKYPECEKLPQRYDKKIIVWGTEPSSKNWIQKGLAIMYDPEHKGGQVILAPVAEDDKGEVRWRYRWVPGPAPYHYEMIPIEPGQAAALPGKLREVADAIEKGIGEWFGGPQGAVKKDLDFHKQIKDNTLSERFRKLYNSRR